MIKRENVESSLLALPYKSAIVILSMKFEHIQQFVFFGLLLTTSVVFIWIISKYLLPVFWALVIAIVFYPFYDRVRRVLGKKETLASLISILAVVVLVVTPIIFVGGLVVQESLTLYQHITQSEDGSGTVNLIERASVFATYLEPYGITSASVEEKLREWAASISKTVASSVLSVSQSTFSFILNIFIMLYLLFFFFKDGEKLHKTYIHYLPLGDAYEERLFKRFSETTRAVVKGTLAIAILQGAIGGITFALAGISAPILWGVFMTLLAIIPVVGPAIVWFPTGVILITTGSIIPGISILLVGILLVSIVDDFLRPILVGREAKMPDAVVLLATLGGLTSLGISGFIVGPIIAAFFLSLWIMFEEKYRKELSKNT